MSRAEGTARLAPHGHNGSVSEPGAVAAERLRAAGVERGGLVALALRDGLGLGLAAADVEVGVDTADPVGVARFVEEALQPRWVVWSNDVAAVLVGGGLRLVRCWDIAAVHRLRHSSCS